MSAGSYKRAQGEPPFTQICQAPLIPALLRPQFQILEEIHLKSIENRITREAATQNEENKIQKRCAQSRERLKEEMQRKIEIAQRRAARKANAAGIVAERKLNEEYQQLCRW